MSISIISVINFKGGVGKTTVSVNLSAALSRLNKKVLIIDIDPQMSASGILLENLDSIIKSNRTFPNMLATHMAGKKIQNHLWIQNIDKNKNQTDPGCLDLICGDHRTEKLEKGLFKKPYVVQKMMVSLFKNDYDFILFDCPPSLNRLTFNALTASDNFIVPTIPDFISIRGIETLFIKMNQYFNRLTSKKLKYPVFSGILLNRISHQKRNIQSTIEGEIQKNINNGTLQIPGRDEKINYIFKQKISDRIDIPRSAQLRKSLLDMDHKSQSAQEFMNFARELLLQF